MKNKFKQIKVGDKFKSTDKPRYDEPIIECIRLSAHFASFKWLNSYGIGSFVLDKKEFNKTLWEVISNGR